MLYDRLKLLVMLLMLSFLSSKFDVGGNRGAMWPRMVVWQPKPGMDHDFEEATNGIWDGIARTGFWSWNGGRSFREARRILCRLARSFTRGAILIARLSGCDGADNAVNVVPYARSSIRSGL